MSGKIAAAWGNCEFDAPCPREEILHGIANHDRGHVDWDARPRLNGAGKPIGFLELTVGDAILNWEGSVEETASVYPLAGLLVSLHAENLMERRLALVRDDSDEKDLLVRFLKSQRSLQEELRPECVGHWQESYPAIDRSVEFGFKLLQTCDWLSLLLFAGPMSNTTLPTAPRKLAGETASVVFTPAESSSVRLDPYPLEPSSLSVSIEGRYVPSTHFESEKEYHLALANAEKVALMFTLQSTD